MGKKLQWYQKSFGTINTKSPIDEKIEDAILEAKFVANKIKELLDNKFQVLTKDREKRDIQYKDIAILLRSTKANAPIYEQEISKLNLPVFCDTASRIFRFSWDTGYDEFAQNNR